MFCVYIKEQNKTLTKLLLGNWSIGDNKAQNSLLKNSIFDIES